MINRIREKSGGRIFFRQGGMPSSHSAFVTSLLIIVGDKMGIESVEFAIATVFAGVVWYDAIAVRGTVGKQSRTLNLIQNIHQFSEEVGHSIREVIAGIIFGLIMTLILI